MIYNPWKNYARVVAAKRAQHHNPLTDLTSTLVVLLTDAECAAIQMAAQRDKLTVSNWMRRVLKKELESFAASKGEQP